MNDDLELGKKYLFESDDSLSKELLNSLIESIPDPFYFKSVDGKYIKVNKAKAETVCSKPEDMVGKTDYDFFPEKYAKKSYEEDKKIIETKEPIINKVEKFKDSHDETFWMSITKKPYFDKNGNLQGILGTEKDITDIKREEEKYELFFKSSPDYIIETTEDGEIISLNPAMAERFNAKPDNLIGKKINDFIPEEILKNRKKIAYKAIKENKIQISEDRNGARYFHNLYVPILSSDGKKSIQCIARDITDQHEMDKALKDSEKRYRTIFENSAVAIMMTDENEEIISWNNYTEKMLGMDKEDLLKKPVNELYTEDEWLKIRRENVRSKGMKHHLETKMIKKDGKLVDVDISVSVLKDKNGNVTGSIGVIRDITKRKKAEEQMKIKDIAIESSVNGMVITDMNGDITYVNDSYLNMWGYQNCDDVKGEPIVKFWNSKGKFVEVMDSLIKKGSWAGELIAEKKDGSTFFTHLSATTVKDNEDKPICMLASFLDITEKKNAEDKIRESEKKYRSVVENANDGIIIIQDGALKFVNPSVERLIGLSKKEIVSKSFLHFVHPDDKKFVANNYKKRMNGEYSPTNYDFRVISKDNEERWVNVSTNKIIWNNEVATLNFLTDITEQKNLSEKLKDSERLFRRLVEQSSVGVYIHDPIENEVLYANPLVRQGLGFSDDEFEKIDFYKYVHPDDVKILKERTKKRLMGEKINPAVEVRINPPDTEMRWVRLYTTFIYYKGRKVALASVIDITENKQAEEKIRESERAKTEFMNIAAHELKTPVIPIKGYLEMLLWDKNLGEEKREWIEICLRNINNLVFLVNDILDVARLESNSMKLVKEKVDMAELIEGIVKDMKPASDKKNLFLESNIKDSSLELNIDKQRIMQVLRNLINNAVKCTNEGKIIVKAKKDEDQNYLIVSVKDTGIGISKEDQSKLFKRFSQLDSGETRKVEGTGLGLYISKGIIEKHGGKIWVESKGPGKGSTFNFSIPLNN